MMKLALINEKIQENYHFKYHSFIVKTTSHVKTQRKFQISPLDGAQYANISSSLKQATGENNARYNSKMKIHHTPIIK